MIGPPRLVSQGATYIVFNLSQVSNRIRLDGSGVGIAEGQMSKVLGVMAKSKRARAFVRDLVGVGIPKGRSKHLACRLLSLAEPRHFGEVVGKSQAGRRVYVVKSKKGRRVFVFKSDGRVVITGASAVSWSPKGRKRVGGNVMAHK